jgi:hypothetical protein
VFACALLTPVAAAAEPQWGIPRPQGSNGTYGTQTAYNEGYTRGVRAGDNDARRGDPFQYVDESDYRRGDAGYQSQYGSRDRYRDEFRRGYVTGYRDGFERISYGGYGGYGVPGTQTGNLPPWSNGRGRAVGRGDRNDLASTNGFNDGYEQGLNDGRDRHRNDPYAESRFRDGDRGTTAATAAVMSTATRIVTLRVGLPTRLSGGVAVQPPVLGPQATTLTKGMRKRRTRNTPQEEHSWTS